MKRKTSILINIASLCLCIGALVVGVISAKTVTASLSGSIGFKAYNCDVDFTGTITGAVLSTASTNKVDSLPTLYIHPTGEPSDSNTNTTISINGGSQSAYDSVKFGNLGFAVNSSSFLPYDITMTFSITNKSEFAVCASLSLEELNVDPSITFSANEYKLKLGDKNSTTKTKEFTVTIKAGSTSVNATLSTSKINFTFEKYNVPTLEQAGYTGTISGNKINITKVPAKTTSSTLTIPAYFSNSSGNLLKVDSMSSSTSSNIKDYSVINFSEGFTTISSSVLRGSSNLTSISIPNSVTSIYYMAFNGCSALAYIKMSANIQTIVDWLATFSGTAYVNNATNTSNYVYGNVIYLTDKLDGSGAKVVALEALNNNVTSVTIANSTKIISEHLHTYLTSLASISVEEGNSIYDSRGNCNAVIKTSTNEIVFGCKNTIIPNSVTSIGDYAFYHRTDLTSITIPSSVKNIGVQAFSCTGLTSITIPGSIEFIGYSTFEACNALESVTLQPGITSLPPCIFAGCVNLTSIIIPSAVTFIGYKAFCDCTSLSSLKFSSGGTWTYSENEDLSSPTGTKEFNTVDNYAEWFTDGDNEDSGVCWYWGKISNA